MSDTTPTPEPTPEPTPASTAPSSISSGWFGAVLAPAGAALLVAKLFGVALPLPVPVRTAVFGLFGLAAVCTLLALFVTPGGDCDDVVLMKSVCDAIDQGHGFGYWLALLAVLGGTALAAMRRSAD